MKEIQISCFFSEKDVEDIARKASLVERKSPITGFKFLLTFSSGLLNTPDGTLSQLAGFLSGACNTDVSPQALDGRINKMAQEFMRLMMEKTLEICKRMLCIDAKNLAGLENVYIIDSTNFELHFSLAEKFKGCGGRASKASMRIQFVFD